jgi:hypothetical protein
MQQVEAFKLSAYAEHLRASTAAAAKESRQGSAQNSTQSSGLMRPRLHTFRNLEISSCCHSFEMNRSYRNMIARSRLRNDSCPLRSTGLPLLQRGIFRGRNVDSCVACIKPTRISSLILQSTSRGLAYVNYKSTQVFKLVVRPKQWSSVRFRDSTTPFTSFGVDMLPTQTK